MTLSGSALFGAIAGRRRQGNGARRNHSGQHRQHRFRLECKRGRILFDTSHRAQRRSASRRYLV